MRGLSFENRAKLACAYGGLIWGVFWIPLRALEAAGVSGAWATVAFYAIPLAIVVPLLLYRWRQILRGGWRLQLIGLFAGLSLVLYSNAFLYTDVVRAMLLYYLCPVWGSLLARIFLKEAITPVRVMAILFGLAGMLVIFGVGPGLPWPKNAGDWIGLSSGIVWAIAMVLMRDDELNGPTELTTVYFLWGTLTALAFVVLVGSGPLPDMAGMVGSLPWLLPVLLLVVMPGVFSVMWGTPHLNPGVVGLLFMTEISVGSATAAVLTDEPFGLREMAGIILISLAGLLEVLVPLFAKIGLCHRTR